LSFPSAQYEYGRTNASNSRATQQAARNRWEAKLLEELGFLQAALRLPDYN
jgi:hypothetical protein